jgi:hypothetical protein
VEEAGEAVLVDLAQVASVHRRSKEYSAGLYLAAVRAEEDGDQVEASRLAAL